MARAAAVASTSGPRVTSQPSPSPSHRPPPVLQAGAYGALAAGSGSDWLILLVPVALVGALVALTLYLRGGPNTSHGYAIDATPRRRREVSPRLLELLRPVFVYNHHRDAYVLRGVGHRVGPVLRDRSAPRRRARLPRPEPEPARTGRFRRARRAGRAAPLTQAEPVAASTAAGPRAPVGARGGPTAVKQAADAPAPGEPQPSRKPAGRRGRPKAGKQDSEPAGGGQLRHPALTADSTATCPRRERDRTAGPARCRRRAWPRRTAPPRPPPRAGP